MGELKDKASQYADAFDGASPLADEENRATKAAKMRAVLADEGVFENANLKILDIGCSFGHILRLLTPETGIGIGIDIDKNIGSHAENVFFETSCSIPYGILSLIKIELPKHRLLRRQCLNHNQVSRLMCFRSEPRLGQIPMTRMFGRLLDPER